jgi:hypothetical protein
LLKEIGRFLYTALGACNGLPISVTQARIQLKEALG